MRPRRSARTRWSASCCAALELARRTRGQARTQAERGGVVRALDGRPVLGGSRRGAIVFVA